MVLGQPDRSNTSYGRTTSIYKDIGVTFDTAGRAVDILGDRLNAAADAGVGDVIVQRGIPEAELVGRLGSGSSKGAYRPSGSGVISCGMKRIGGEHRYRMRRRPTPSVSTRSPLVRQGPAQGRTLS